MAGSETPKPDQGGEAFNADAAVKAEAAAQVPSGAEAHLRQAADTLSNHFDERMSETHFFKDREVIDGKDLSLLQEAAGRTGMNVEVLKQPGEEYTSTKGRTYTLGEQYAVSVSGRVSNEEGTSPFRDEYRRLKTERDAQQEAA